MSTSLCFYWYEIKADEEFNRCHGQIVWAIDRLAFVIGELASVSEATDLDEMLKRLQYHAENYLICIYELRERVVSLVADLYGKKNLAESLKSKKKDKHGKVPRDEALAKIGTKLLSFVEPLKRLLIAMDQDIELRNHHTHNTFLSLGLWTGNDIYNLQDALLNLEDKPDERVKLESFLREEAKLLATDYAEKGREVFEATMCLLKVADPWSKKK